MVDKRIEARAYTRLEGEDAPEIADWTWPGVGATARGAPAERRPGSSSSTRGPAASSCGSWTRADGVVAEADLPPPRGRGRRRRRAPRPIEPFGPVDAVGPPGGPRRDRGSPAPVVVDEAVARRDPRAHGARAAPPAEVASRASRRSRAALPGRAARRLLRHRVPRHDPGRGRDLRAPRRRGASAGRPAPVRVPRAVARLRVAAGRGAAGPRRATRTCAS